MPQLSPTMGLLIFVIVLFSVTFLMMIMNNKMKKIKKQKYMEAIKKITWKSM